MYTTGTAGFIADLKSRSHTRSNFIVDLDKIGKFFSIKDFKNSTANKHAEFMKYGFKGNLFEVFGQELVEMLVSTNFVQVGYRTNLNLIVKFKNNIIKRTYCLTDVSRRQTSLDAIVRVFSRRAASRIREG